MMPAALATLRDIHLPLFPALVLGLVAALGLLLAGAAWGVHRYRRRAPLRAALRELDAVLARHVRDGNTTQLVASVSQLLRRYAMWRFARDEVAGLTGPDWLAFLDTHGGEEAFRSGVGAVLAWRPYRREGALDQAALVALARRWLQRNAP